MKRKVGSMYIEKGKVMLQDEKYAVTVLNAAQVAAIKLVIKDCLSK